MGGSAEKCLVALTADDKFFVHAARVDSFTTTGPSCVFFARDPEQTGICVLEKSWPGRAGMKCEG